MVGGHHNMRDVLKGCSIRKIENHCARVLMESSWEPLCLSDYAVYAAKTGHANVLP